MDQDNKNYEMSRRLKRISFTVPVPKWVMKQVFELLPDDTELVACGFDNFENRLSSLILKSGHFDVCPEFKAVPELMIKGRSDTRTIELVEWIKQENGQSEERVYQWQS